MKTLKLYYAGFWENFNVEDNFFSKILKKTLYGLV